MPTYQYACTECEHAFEQVQSFSDDTLTECPECTGRLRKIFNAVGVVFKGSGFYRNDSRPKEPSSSGASTGSSSGAGSSSDSKSDSTSSSGSTSADSGSSTKTTSPAAASSGSSSTGSGASTST